MSSQGNRKNCKTNSYSSSLINNPGGRKALEELLTAKLFTPSTISTTTKYKQTPLKNYLTKAKEGKNSHTKQITEHVSKNKAYNLKKKNCDKAKLSCIDGWLVKSINVPPAVKNYDKAKLSCIDGWVVKNINVPPAVKHSDTETKGIQRESSGSFDKYGMYVPSYKDVVDYKEKLDKYKECINSLDMDDTQDSIEFIVEEKQKPTNVLDCKHLTDNEIKESFERNNQFICDIYNGTRFSARHERFKKENYKDQFTVNDLKYNTSMITFTFDQKQLLLSFLYKKFNKDENFCSNTRYFFKVLLPELCTKIFMDVHGMTYAEATKYLEERPI